MASFRASVILDIPPENQSINHWPVYTNFLKCINPEPVQLVNLTNNQIINSFLVEYNLNANLIKCCSKSRDLSLTLFFNLINHSKKRSLIHNLVKKLQYDPLLKEILDKMFKNWKLRGLRIKLKSHAKWVGENL